MRKIKQQAAPVAHALTPNEVIRKSVAPLYFGLGQTAIDKKIKSGEIPAPIKLGKRATGWFGHKIIAYQKRLTGEAP